MALRKKVHLTFAGIFLIFVFFFKWLDNKSIITILLDIAGYTYGPLLGLFVFGIFSKRKVNDILTPVACIIPPIITFIINTTAPLWAGSYAFGLELLIINGAMTAGLLLLFSRVKQ
jgi:hypothetical protein